MDDFFGPAAGDPLFAGGAAAPAGFGPPTMPGAGGPPRPRRKKGPNMVLIAGIAGGGVGLLLIMIVVLLLVFGKKGGTDVALTPTPVVAPEAVTPTPVAAPTAPTVAPPTPPVSTPPMTPTSIPEGNPTATLTYNGTDSAGNPVEITEVGSGSSGSSKRTPFTQAVTNWHVKADGMFRGAIAKEGEKLEDGVIVYQFSWMTQLLPYLGYDRIHKKIDFKKSWHEAGNYQAAQYRIPQFLTPGDDRKAWEGYQFPNLGLTHFVGMSGVEETRQEVAAKFKRDHERAGIFGYESVAKESEITDGKNQTIMVIGAGELIGPWAVGGGVTVRGARATQIDASGKVTYDYFNSHDGFGTKGQEGPQTMFADGSVRILNPKMDPAVFRAMCTIHGKETVDLKDVGATKEKFATQDFDPLKNEAEIKVLVVRRIGDGGDDSDDDGEKASGDDDSKGDGDKDDEDKSDDGGEGSGSDDKSDE